MGDGRRTMAHCRSGPCLGAIVAQFQRKGRTLFLRPCFGFVYRCSIPMEMWDRLMFLRIASAAGVPRVRRQFVWGKRFRKVMLRLVSKWICQKPLQLGVDISWPREGKDGSHSNMRTYHCLFIFAVEWGTWRSIASPPQPPTQTKKNK